MSVAADLFEARAYHTTSMEAIAERVGIRKASLYYYFSSKEDLLAQMHLGMIEPIIDAHRERLQAQDLDPEGLLLAMMTDLVSLTETHPGHMRWVLDRFGELPEQVQVSVMEQGRRYRGLLEEVLERGQDEGVFVVADRGMAALTVLGLCTSTYQWFRPGGKYAASQVAQYLYDTLINGIGASAAVRGPGGTGSVTAL
ncbi:MAG TPA: TetR/AcrR family transcriptional regulator [Mycobacteriales bacterium]|nr:TetR/AcrR family transcriptional regulator [Mycobacteriales bacterium]